VTLYLYWSEQAQDNCVTTAAHPPTQPGYQLVRPITAILPLDAAPPLVTVVLSLYYRNGDYFTLASNASRAEAVAAGYQHVADLGRLLPPVANVSQIAAQADVAVVCVSAPSGEGHDRTNLSLTWNDIQLIRSVAQAQRNTVVVLHAPAAVTMPDWIAEVRRVGL
jgi:hypothetical protein